MSIEPSARSGRKRTDGAKNHYLSFMVSILLTMLAFAITINGGMSKQFLYMFLILLAIVQVIFQLSYWMHMKERGHIYPIIGLAFGAFVVLGGVLSAIYWMWWN
ncbi:cytochrome C oxidase subunit IV family protein [Gorillibacterium massiliense]|uniref:cytochrome C oxidase subunit IV family protein n=1 Tax=Gorillibacterium massiliense TaxID=1280390 RepID=UPI0004AECD8B|nr:cytochrome C oxidase subunit IV family protein [Gorillibacterium massiliense]